MADFTATLEDLRAGRNLAWGSIANGLLPKDLPAEFVHRGLDVRLAPIVDRYMRMEAAQLRQRAIRRNLCFGLIPLVLGAILLFSTATWLPVAAALGGASMIWGVYPLVTGVIHFFRHDRMALEVCGLPFPLAALWSADEHVAEARRKLKASNDAAFWSLVFGGASGLATFLVLSKSSLGQNAEFIFLALPAVLTGLVVGFGSLLIMLKAGAPPNAQAAVPSEPAPAPQVTSYAIPMVSRTELPKSEREIAEAERCPNFPAAATVGGPVAMPPKDGVLYMTKAGIVFLPASDGESALSFKSVGKAATELAAEASPVVGFFHKASATFRDEIPASETTLRVHGLQDPSHFTIPWLRLIKASYDPLTSRTIVVRQEPDGGEAAFAFRSNAPQLSAILMAMRFDAEHDRCRLDLVFSEAEQHRAELLPKYREIYGDRIDDHHLEIVREAMARTDAICARDPARYDSQIRELLGPLLPTFAGIESLVEDYPDLFAPRPTAVMPQVGRETEATQADSDPQTGSGLHAG